MMHVKAGIALLSEMVADLARACALYCRILAGHPLEEAVRHCVWY